MDDKNDNDVEIDVKVFKAFLNPKIKISFAFTNAIHKQILLNKVIKNPNRIK